jgi:hypothetical protein
VVPPENALPSSSCWGPSGMALCPLLGMMLAMIGFVLLAAGVDRLGPPASPVRAVSVDSTRAGAPTRTLVAPPLPQEAWMGAWSEDPHPAPGPDPHVPGRSRGPSACLNEEFARGTRAESAQLATILLQRDPREFLITLAAVQHGGPGTWSGPCLMRRLTVQDPGQANSDDRIANALVALAPLAAPQRPTGPS